MDDTADHQFNSFDPKEFNLQEFSAFHKVEKEDTSREEMANNLKNNRCVPEIIYYSDKGQQEMIDDSDMDKQEIENQESAMGKNNGPDSICMEANRLLASINNMKPDFNSLFEKTQKARKEISGSPLRKDPRAEMFLFELELLKNHLLQMQSELRNMTKDVCELLSGKLKTCDGSDIAGVPEGESGEGLSHTQELGDVELSDSDFSPLDSTQDGLEVEKGVTGNIKRDGRTTSAVEGYEAESNLGSGDAPSTAKKYGAETTKLRTSKSVSIKRLKKPVEKSFKKFIKSLCHLCGMVTLNGNDHMRENHPDVKEFPCRECDAKFEDFESMLHHQAIHKSKKARDFHLAVESVSKKVTFAHESCKICGEIIRNRFWLIDHLEQVHKVKAKSVKFDNLCPCLICDEIFYSKVDLQRHVDLHYDMLKCKLCEESFADPFKLREHLLEHNKKFSCEICGKKSFNARYMENHRKTHMKQVTCQVCGRSLGSQSKLEEHMNKHLGNKPHECDICHVKLFSASALESHKTRVHSVKNGGCKCYICGERLKSPFGRNSHLLSAHTEEERRLHDVVVPMFKCDICGKNMRQEYRFKHLSRHKSVAERKQNVCEMCGQSFFSFLELKTHMFLKHGDENSRLAAECVKKEAVKGEYTCKICGKLYPTYRKLYKHDYHIHQKRNFFCQICGKSFRFHQRLKNHEMIHSGTKPFQCDTCGKRFVKKELLTWHYRIHTGEKPHICQVCGLRFSWQGNLSRHISAVHEKERKFRCEVCSKCFGQKVSLIDHRRIHTGERPYSCPVCCRSFSDRSTFYKHKRLHVKKSQHT